MEKISYQPFIQHLQDDDDWYKQMCRNHELHYGSIDGRFVSSWMVNLIEPLVRSVDEAVSGKMQEIGKAWFTELLLILGNQYAVIYELEYKAAWKLMGKVPEITSAHPSRMIRAIDSAIESIRQFYPDKVHFWIDLMEQMIQHCQDINEVLSLGRIFGWLSGLAYLRERAISEYHQLRFELKDVLNEGLKNMSFEIALNCEWINLQSAAFAGEVGGFTGFGSYFKSPPLAALVNEHILVSDNNVTCILFADHFGKALLPEIPASSEMVVSKVTTEGLKTFRLKYGKDLIPFDDISSCVLTKSTLVVTRKSSHYVYVYGWSI